MITEYHTCEMEAHTKRNTWNALKFGTTGEVHSQEGEAHAEGLMLAPPDCSEVGKPPGELNGAVREALVLQPLLQCPRTKLIFDVRIDNQFLD